MKENKMDTLIEHSSMEMFQPILNETEIFSNPNHEIRSSEPTAEHQHFTQDELVSIHDFCKIKLRVAQIVFAEKLDKSKKLLKLQVDLGSELGERQIISGIAEHYHPEDLIGRKIVVVANLQPAKIMGEVSEGMLLAVSDNFEKLDILSPDELVPNGAEVR